jgi:hypothetical protein
VSIHLHQDFLVRMPLFDLLTELKAGIGKVAHVNDDKIVLGNGRNHRAGRIEINGGINVIASHPQHQRPQMLHGAIAVNKQNTKFVFRCRLHPRELLSMAKSP